MTTTPEQALAQLDTAMTNTYSVVAATLTKANADIEEARQALAVEEERTARHSQWLTDIRTACGGPAPDALADTVRQLATRAEQAAAVTAETKRLLDRRTTTLRVRAEQAEQRLRHAHEARRHKAAQLDDVKRALLDTGVIEDDDPYGHADLADIIRQAMTDRAHTEQGDASVLRLSHSAAAAWQQRAEQAEQRLASIRDLAQRMRAGSPQGAAAIYADRIEHALDTTPEQQ